MGRIIAGIVLGIVAAFVSQSLVDIVGNLVYPTPRVNIFDKAEVAAVFANRPVAALAITVLGYVVGAAIGGYVTKVLSRRAVLVWVPVAVMELLALIVGLYYSPPTWVVIGLIVAPILGGLIARHMGPSRWDAADGDRLADGVDAEA